MREFCAVEFVACPGDNGATALFRRPPPRTFKHNIQSYVSYAWQVGWKLQNPAVIDLQLAIVSLVL